LFRQDLVFLLYFSFLIGYFLSLKYIEDPETDFIILCIAVWSCAVPHTQPLNYWLLFFKQDGIIEHKKNVLEKIKFHEQHG